jgi:peroxiredoxin
MEAALGTAIGNYAPDFELPGTDGSVHHLARYLEKYQAVAVVFMCNHCPYVKLYTDRLKQLQQEFSDRRFTIIGINPNDTEQFPEDSFEKMGDFVTSAGLNFPYLRDVTQDVAQTFGAEKTPHVFLVDQKGLLRYSGAIDDNAQTATAVSQPFLKTAIEQVLSERSVQPIATNPVGCSVKWRQ